jgi:hypothetical protein
LHPFGLIVSIGGGDG